MRHCSYCGEPIVFSHYCEAMMLASERKFTQADMDEHASKVLKAAAETVHCQSCTNGVEVRNGYHVYGGRESLPCKRHAIMSLTPASIEMADAERQKRIEDAGKSLSAILALGREYNPLLSKYDGIFMKARMALAALHAPKGEGNNAQI